MKRVTMILVAMLIFLAACQQQPTTPAPVVTPPVETPPMETPPVETMEPLDDANVIETESGLDKAFGAIDASQIITEDDVVCDKTAKTLSFRFRNVGTDVSWRLDQNLPFPAPKGIAAVKILVNHYEANKRGARYVENGETLFGPNEKFVDNCGGIEVLAPGEEATCSFTNVPFVDGTEIAAGVNEIYVDTPGQGGRVRFTCD